MKLRYKAFNLPFTHPFTISHGTKTHQPTLIVELSLGSFAGYGEAAAINYYNITVDKMITDLEAKKTFVEKFALTDPERYWHYLHHLLPGNPFLVCALDMAAWDLWGRMRGQPVYKMWGTDFSEAVPLTDFTIGIDSIEKMVAKMHEKPWPVYKIKLGTPDDIAMVEALRTETSATFRVDANAGWSTEEAMQKIPLLANLGVEFVEQPLEKSNWEGMKALFERSPLPLIADESCVFEEDVEKCKGYFHGINIKLTKCSGLTPARRMIKKARELQMQVMMGCMNESSVGAAAIAQFLPQLDFVDADGPLLLAQDIASGLNYVDGHFKPSGQPGLGVNIKF
jgi:L-alanine-DL-glutamate epimerase-like enolase superfamily enzyme